MERHNLGDELFRLVNVYLAENGIAFNRGSIVDATIISTPTSTKNKTKTRDPDMHQTRKGNQWYFGKGRYYRPNDCVTVIITNAGIKVKWGW